MEKEERIKLVQSVNYWWHWIDFGDGVVTPGHQGGCARPTATKETLKRLHLPEDLTGKSLLDIGAWDGAMSFEAEKRGASPVVATDIWQNTSFTSAGFDTAHKIFDSKVQKKVMTVYDLSPESVGLFDIVLFSGVIYHLEDPMLALRRVYSVTKDLCIIESAIQRRLGTRFPNAIFIEGDAIYGDRYNYWMPNSACLTGMLREVGFRDVKVVDEDFEIPKIIENLDIFGLIGRFVFWNGRISIHARK